MVSQTLTSLLGGDRRSSLVHARDSGYLRDIYGNIFAHAEAHTKVEAQKEEEEGKV